MVPIFQESKQPSTSLNPAKVSARMPVVSETRALGAATVSALHLFLLGFCTVPARGMLLRNCSQSSQVMDEGAKAPVCALVHGPGVQMQTSEFHSALHSRPPCVCSSPTSTRHKDADIGTSHLSDSRAIPKMGFNTKPSCRASHLVIPFELTPSTPDLLKPIVCWQEPYKSLSSWFHSR